MEQFKIQNIKDRRMAFIEETTVRKQEAKVYIDFTLSNKHRVAFHFIDGGIIAFDIGAYFDNDKAPTLFDPTVVRAINAYQQYLMSKMAKCQELCQDEYLFMHNELSRQARI